MTTILHSKASEGARHPCFNVRYATIAARDAFVTAADADVGKRVMVDSPLSEWLMISHTAGVPRWLLCAIAELPVTGSAPAVSEEIDTGYVRTGEGRIYMRRFQDNSPTEGTGNEDTLATGILSPVSVDDAFASRSGGGSINGKLFPPAWCLDGNTIRIYFYVDASNNLKVGTTSATMDGEPYDVVLRYTKV